MAWLSYAGELDPIEQGRALQEERAKRRKRFDCPQPAYGIDKSIQRVAVWANMTFLEALEMREEAPETFRRLLDWANAEQEAEPIAYKWAEKKAKDRKKHDKEVAASLKR